MKSRVAALIFMFVISACEGQVHTEANAQHNAGMSLEDRQQREPPVGLDAWQLKYVASPVDFRYAARVATPGVVHINATWNSVTEDNPVWEKINPFHNFLGDEFWFHFFEPFLKQGPLQSSASGVIVTSDGYIITNNHVMEGADEIEVVLHDRRSYPARAVGADRETDIALLKIDEKDLIFIKLGNSDNVEVGEWVLAVGNPFNLASTATAGIVSAKARNIHLLKEQESIESFIQTDAAVNPGNSGGALVNLNGELIGINTAIATPTGTYAGYSFAVPVNIVKKVVDDLLIFGTVQRGYVGVTILDMTGSLARKRNIRFVAGVYIDSLVAGGGAMEAGIECGDVITNMDGKPVESIPQFQEVVAKRRPGEKIKVLLMRNNEERSAIVELKGKESLRQNDGGNERIDNVLQVLGIDVEELTPQEKQSAGLTSGLKVTGVYKGRVQQFTDMRVGFIITKVEGLTVKTKSDLVAVLQNKKNQNITLEGTYPAFHGVIYYVFGF